MSDVKQSRVVRRLTIVNVDVPSLHPEAIDWTDVAQPDEPGDWLPISHSVVLKPDGSATYSFWWRKDVTVPC